MHELILVQDLSIVMIVSAITVVVCRLLHLPLVLGYILAGFIIGPHTPPYSLVKDIPVIHTLSTLGVIFLMFSIGLEFSLTKLSKVGVVAILAAVFEIALMMFIGFSLGKFFHWSSMDSLFLGAILAISSTTIIAKILMEKKIIQEKFAQVILGILVIEDLLAIVIIAVLSGIATTGALSVGEVSWSMLKVGIFVTMILVVGSLLIRHVLAYAKRLKSAEMMIVIILGLCLGVSLLAAKFGFSVALGAFLIGAIIAETIHVHEIIKKMEPIKDMFTAIFFVSVGMLIDPALLAQYWLPIILITLTVIIGKIFACSLATFLTGYDATTALKVGLGLAQIGEFSFIIAQLGQTSAVTSSFLYPIAVSVCAITTMTTPLLMNHAEVITGFIKKTAPSSMLTVAKLYTPWVVRISQGGINTSAKTLMMRDLAKYFPILMMYVAGVCGVYWAGDQWRHLISVSDGFYGALVMLLMLPFLIGCAHVIDKILWDGIFLNIIRLKKELHQSKNAEAIFHNTIRFVVSVLVGLIILTVMSFFVNSMQVAVGIGCVIIIAGILLWRSIHQAHEHVERVFSTIFESKMEDSQQHMKIKRENFIEMMRSENALEFETIDFILPLEESALNVTIAQLNLRAHSGASIVAVYRDFDSITNPGPTVKLLPADVLLLIGDASQLQAAIAYLKERLKAENVDGK